MKKVSVVFRDEELYQALKVRAALEQRTLQSVITEALEQWVEACEDTDDIAFAEAAMREKGNNIPWGKVKDELGSYNPPN